MGMLATTINCIALADALEQAGIPAVHMTSLAGIPESIPFRHDLANKLLADGTVLVISGGTGLPFFSTDTAACVRGLQIGAAVVLKATQVDGVYDRDPRQRGARRLAQVSFERALRDRLAFMDQPALALAAEHGLPVLVFQGHGKGALAAGLMGRAKGSLVGNEQE
jgi:uridylate kinase